MEEETYPVECVRDVAKHDGGANVAAIENALAANTVVLIMRMMAGAIELRVLAGE